MLKKKEIHFMRTFVARDFRRAFARKNDFGAIRGAPRDGIPFGMWQTRFVEWARDLGMLPKK